jgi:hypothetical protein
MSGVRKRYFWLLLAFPWGVVQGATRADCIAVLSPVHKIAVPEKKTFGESPDPVYHALNTKALLDELKSKGKIEFQLSPFSVAAGLKKLCSKEIGVCFVVVEQKNRWPFSGGTLVLKGADGKWFEVAVGRTLLPGSTLLKIDFSAYRYVASETANFDAALAKIRTIYHREFFDERNADELGDYLSVKQLSHSSNFNRSKEAIQKRFTAAIREANRLLAEKLVKGEPLDRKILNRINFLANEGINPYENVQNEALAGILRGTDDQTANLYGVTTPIDLRKFQVFQRGKDGSILNEFLPASQVPEAIDHWLAEVNRLGPQSDPVEIFSLYKRLVAIHPYADANGRTSRMTLNYMLLKAGLPPLDFPAHSLYFRPEDILRKYVQAFENGSSSLHVAKNSGTPGVDFYSLRSFTHVKDMNALARDVQQSFQLEKVTLEHLHGTSGYIFVGTYKGRFIQFESTRFGEELSDSLGAMVSRSMGIIDEQEGMAKIMGGRAPTYAIYPELLEQKRNYHLLYETDYLEKKFVAVHRRLPNEHEKASIVQEGTRKTRDLLARSARATSDRELLDDLMRTPRLPDQAHTIEDVVNRILAVTAPEFKAKIRKAMLEKASESMKESFVEVYNAFNSPKFDAFMSEVAIEALALCREARVCTGSQSTGIPDRFLAQVLKNSADKLGITVETISRYAGREPGRLYFQRIHRASLIFDDGAPGNHGMMPHALQNLFIYRELGRERTQSFFKELTGWVYERMFDSNAAFTPIPSTRDITRRHYWTGVFKAGNRSDISKLGVLVGEQGHYPGFLRENNLELVSVEEQTTAALLNAGSVVRARYKGREFTFRIDRDGVPESDAAEIVDAVKREMDRVSSP